jgi:hypothetical protein
LRAPRGFPLDTFGFIKDAPVDDDARPDSLLPGRILHGKHAHPPTGGKRCLQE